MCPKSLSTITKKRRRVVPKGCNVSNMLQYTPPVYKELTVDCYIEFYAYDPALGKMRRKRIKINRIKGVAKRRQYAKEVIQRLTDQLTKGWNPWIINDIDELELFETSIQHYESHLEKMISSGYFRKETYDGYKSNIKIMREFIAKKRPTHYTYQFDRRFCTEFLDYIFIDRDNGAQTRNNYLNFLRVFSGFLVEKGYLQSKPTDGIAPISKRLYKKERSCIPLEVIEKIAEHCRKKDPHFLLACYLLYYGFIRPVEMTRLKISNINVKNCTVTIPGSASKNKKTQTITLPKKVMAYAIELGIFGAASEDYIFSYGLKPGKEEINPKHFRDHWEKLRKPLRLKKEWKFYSLKDTGITAMLKDNVPAIDVRDQARHSSLAITEIYTDHSGRVNPDIWNLEGAL